MSKGRCESRQTLFVCALSSGNFSGSALLKRCWTSSQEWRPNPMLAAVETIQEKSKKSCSCTSLRSHAVVRKGSNWPS
jgi:hypothetical protein